MIFRNGELISRETWDKGREAKETFDRILRLKSRPRSTREAVMQAQEKGGDSDRASSEDQSESSEALEREESEHQGEARSGA